LGHREPWSCHASAFHLMSPADTVCLVGSMLVSLDEAIAPKLLPPDLLSHMEIPLGFVATDTLQAARRKSSVQSTPGALTSGLPQIAGSDSILAFLSRDFWVCTHALSEARPGRVKRHHFCPETGWTWTCRNVRSCAVMVRRCVQGMVKLR